MIQLRDRGGHQGRAGSGGEEQTLGGWPGVKKGRKEAASLQEKHQDRCSAEGSGTRQLKTNICVTPELLATTEQTLQTESWWQRFCCSIQHEQKPRSSLEHMLHTALRLKVIMTAVLIFNTHNVPMMKQDRADAAVITRWVKLLFPVDKTRSGFTTHNAAQYVRSIIRSFSFPRYFM